jgi:mRNA interferase RelE/StbE
MPADQATLIRKKIDQYVVAPLSLANNVKRLVGMDGIFRLRVGDWRVLFKDDGTVMAIIKIASRGDIYEGIKS